MSTAHALPALGLTIGAAFLGLVFSAILYGITNLQTYIYYHEYPNDWKMYRYSVGILWVLDSFHLSLTIHAIYHYIVDSFGDYAALNLVVWSFKVQIAVNVVIVVMVQCLYTVRLWKLGSHFHKLLPAIVIIVVLAGTAIGILLTYEVARLSTFSGLKDMAWVVDASFAVATVIDFAIAFAMCYYLQKTRTVSDFANTNSRVVTIMRYVLISGLATSVCSMLALITFITMPNTLVFLGIEFLLTKLYVNSFLSMLNARKRIAGRNGTEGSSTSKDGTSNVLRLNTTTPGGEGTNKNFIPLNDLARSPGERWNDPEAMRKSVGFAV